MILAERLEKLLQPVVEDLGFAIVRLQIRGTQRKTLEILIEGLDGSSVTVGNCAKVSREVAVFLELEDPIADPYILEVSSPGVDRPLIKVQDYQRFKGQRLKLQTKDPIMGRRKFKGRLEDVQGQEIIVLCTVDTGGEEQITFKLDNIDKAKLDPDLTELLRKRKDKSKT